MFVKNCPLFQKKDTSVSLIPDTNKRYQYQKEISVSVIGIGINLGYQFRYWYLFLFDQLFLNLIFFKHFTYQLFSIQLFQKFDLPMVFISFFSQSSMINNFSFFQPFKIAKTSPNTYN